jgi:hypothetical protein
MSSAAIDNKPLLISQPRAKQLLDIGNTKFHELKKAGVIETVRVGGRPMVVYSSLEKLAHPSKQNAA